MSTFRSLEHSLGYSQGGRFFSSSFSFSFLHSEKFITKDVGQLGVGWLGDVGYLGLTIEKDSRSARR